MRLWKVQLRFWKEWELVRIHWSPAKQWSSMMMLKTQPFPWHWKKEKIKRSWNEEEQSENTSVIFCCFCLNETHCLSHTQCVWADRNQSSVTEILNEKITIAFFVLVFMLWCSLLPTYHFPKSSSLGAAALPALLQGLAVPHLCFYTSAFYRAF